MESKHQTSNKGVNMARNQRIFITRETKNVNGHISEGNTFTVRYGARVCQGLTKEEARKEAIIWTKMYKAPAVFA